MKNLVGDIEINSAGDFIRTTEYGGKKKKEGIYSPITQNQRHLELMKRIKTDSKNGFFKKMMTNRYFEDFNKSIVVLANPRTVLNAKYSKKEVKSQVIRADQLVSYIKEACKNCKEMESSEDATLAWAQSYLDFHIEKEHDYSAKFGQYMKQPARSCVPDAETTAPNIDNAATPDRIASPEKNDVSIEETAIFKELRSYRLSKSREENVKPYFIYNDNQLKDLISKMPVTMEALKTVSGFGDVKAVKYGDGIFQIVKKYR